MWYISLDYINHQTSLTADQARTDPDGMMRFVISERDPGVANWLECTGHSRGYVQIRWQRLARDLRPADGPRAEVVRFADLPALPEPDEVADAVVFLASSMARAITGQCLDVNCGEYHH